MIKFGIVLILIPICFGWDNIPQIPTGRRSQYFLLNTEDGGYKYGYDTGIDSFAKQSGSSLNEVEGSYSYTAPSGEKFDLKYTSGVNGFVPESIPLSYSQPPTSEQNEEASGDASYSFTIDTDTYKRQESSDASGNVQGQYSYTNDAGNHDLSYTAGSNTGFVAVSGSLATPNGLSSSNLLHNPLNADGSYTFSYNAGDSSRQESADAAGNVEGSYSYTDTAGMHNLNYKAGSDTGFIVTGGSLAAPTTDEGNSVTDQQSDDTNIPGDASYNFSINTDEYQRQESSDAAGNIQGSYSYKNEAGTHDLSFNAGSETGFLPTGGSLQTPPGLNENQLNIGAAAAKARTSLPPAIPVIPIVNTQADITPATIQQYSPLINGKQIVGYIYDTK